MIENNGKTITITNSEFERVSLSVPCIICEEPVYLSPLEEMVCRNGTIVKVCNECKHAVMEMRKQIEKKKRKEKASTPNNICAMH